MNRKHILIKNLAKRFLQKRRLGKVCRLPGFLFFACLLLLSNVLRGQKPNIILIVADYMGYADIEPFGSLEIKPLSLKRLAFAGIKYTNFYAPAPACSPSRAALLTGRYPAKIRLERNVTENDTGLTSRYPTMATKLKNAGYATGLIGKWHLGFTNVSTPAANGFEYFFGFKDWSIDYYRHTTFNNANGLYYNETPVSAAGYSTDIFTDSAISFISKHQESPFFLCLFYNAALPPLQPHGDTKIRDSSSWWKGSREDYVRVVERMDDGIGKVMDQLDKDSLTKNTIVIFTYDHGGGELVDNGKFFHGFGTIWEGGVRVPMIIRYPALKKKNVMDDGLFINMDIAYTLLSAAGIKPGNDLDGIDLFKNDNNANRFLFWRWRFNGRNQSAVRNEQWKFVTDNGTELLFNLEKDPGERKNVGYMHPEIKEALRKKLKEWDDKNRY